MGYLYELPNATSGLDAIVVQLINTGEDSGSGFGFIPLLLAFVFFTIFLSGIGKQKARTGTADYPMWSVIASLATFFTTLILSLYTGFIHVSWLVIMVVITIFSAVWLFLDRKISEV